MSQKEIFDLDAAIAEATGEPFQFRYAGRDWAMCAPGLVPLDMLDAAESGTLDPVKEVLRFAFDQIDESGDTWREFDAVPNKSVSAYNELFKKWMAEGGFVPGEARRSRTSSGSTAKPSKRTSRARGGR